MRMFFLSDVPLHEQLIRAGNRKKVGRKHNKTKGPGRQKKQPPNNVKKAAAWRKYHEQVALFFSGHRPEMPKKPYEK